MEHPLDDHRIPSFGPKRRARLLEAGVCTLEDLLAAEVSVLAALPGLNESLIMRARGAAVEILRASRALEEQRSSDAIKPLRRGLKAARQIESTLDWTRQARALVEQDLDSKANKRLRKLGKALERAQTEVLTHGLTKIAASELQSFLEDLDRRLNRFTKTDLDQRDLQKIGRAAKRARKALLNRIV